MQQQPKTKYDNLNIYNQYFSIIEDIISILGNVDYNIYKNAVFNYNGIKVTTNQILRVLDWLNKNKHGFDLAKLPQFDFILMPNDDNSIKLIIIHHPLVKCANGYKKFPLNSLKL